MRNVIISLLVFALLQQANSLSCQIIDQKLPPNNTADCTPGYDFVVTGIKAPFDTRYTINVVNSNCGNLTISQQYRIIGDIVLNKTCGITHGGQGDVKIAINGSVTFLNGDSCNCTGQATRTCNKIPVLSCQIIDQKLPPNDTSDCTPGYGLVVTGINASVLEPFNITVGSSECGKYILGSQYLGPGDIVLNRNCSVSHGGQGDVKLAINGSISFYKSGSCNCTGYASITCNKSGSTSLGLTAGLVVAGLVVLGAVGFLVYKKFLKKNQSPNANYQNMPN